MTAEAQKAALDARLAELSRHKTTADPADVVEIVQAILATMEGDFNAVNARFFSEIEDLARYINETKAEIAALRPDEITEEHLPTATDELQAVVGATEQATTAIFEAVEAIEELAGQMPPEVSAKVVEAVTKVYEATSFQDITGQRISKVVDALQHIDTKVKALLEAFGSELQRPEEPPKAPVPAAEKRDEDLMNGPQLPEDAQSQDEIDALLASLE